MTTASTRVMSSFAELAQLLETAPDLTRLARRVVGIAVEGIGAQAAELRIFEGPAGPSRRLAIAGTPFRDHHASERTVLEVRDTGARVERAPKTTGGSHVVAIPISVSGRVVGVLRVRSEAGGLDGQQREMLGLLAWMASTTAREIERNMVSRILDAVRQIGETVGGYFEPVAVAQVVMAKASELLGADSAGMAWWDGATLQSFSNELPAEFTPSWTRESGPHGHIFRRLLEPGQGALGRAYSTGTAIVVPNYRDWDRRLDQAFGSVIAVPLVIQGNPTGALIVRYLERRDLPPTDVGLLTLLAAQVAPALEASRLSADLIESEVLLRKTTEANLLKSEFMATMSHELRTPLSAIIGFSDLILTGRGEALEPEIVEEVAEINRSGLTLLQLIEDILDFSKLEAGQLEVEIQPVELGTVLREVVEAVMPLARAKGLDCRLEDPGGTAVASCDSGRTHQILKNLLLNAIKFTPNGAITAGLLRREGEIEIYVADQGVGIRAEAVDRIFDGFVQAEQTTTRRFGGLGLGLAVARNLVTIQGGSMGVESRPGGGSRFWFRLPAAPEGDAWEPRLAAPHRASAPHLRQPSIRGPRSAGVRAGV